MKTASFRDYLEKRLNKEEIQEIRQQVDTEFAALKELQENVSLVLTQSFTSSQRKKRQIKKANPTSNIEGRLRKELKALARKKDKDLDFSDIPEIDFDSLGVEATIP